MDLTERETAHVLACLRHCQGLDLSRMEHFEGLAPLADKEVDALCERLNEDGLAAAHYTVLCFLPERHWYGSMRDASRVDWVEAETPLAAAEMARRQAASLLLPESDQDPTSQAEEVTRLVEDIEILGVFEGCLSDLYDPAADTGPG